MYLKILSRDKDKTNTLAGVSHVEFFHQTCRYGEDSAGRTGEEDDGIRALLDCCDLPLVTNELAQTDYEKSEGIVCVGCFNVTLETGKKQFIVFDGVAFLCNESGKAVERYVVN